MFAERVRNPLLTLLIIICPTSSLEDYIAAQTFALLSELYTG